MAILLDVKTPTCCYNCPCYDGNDGNSRCEAAEKDVKDGDIRQEWCPICGEVYVDIKKAVPNADYDIDTDAIAYSILHTPDKWEHSCTIKKSEE